MSRWYIKAETDNGQVVEGAFKVGGGSNPLEENPSVYGHSFVELGTGESIFDSYASREDVADEAIERDDIRYTVDELDTDTEYWILDAHDALGEYFPSVPDIPGISNPTYFVAVPRDAVMNVYEE